MCIVHSIKAREAELAVVVVVVLCAASDKGLFQFESRAPVRALCVYKGVGIARFVMCRGGDRLSQVYIRRVCELQAF